MPIPEPGDLIRQHQKAAPVKLITLARSLGLRVFTTTYLDPTHSGMLRVETDRGGSSGYAITLNAALDQNERRYATAHLMAHFLLHRAHVGAGIIENSQHWANGFNAALEREANEMTRDILMPWHLVQEAHACGIDNIALVAKYFGVHTKTAAHRLLGALNP